MLHLIGSRFRELQVHRPHSGCVPHRHLHTQVLPLLLDLPSLETPIEEFRHREEVPVLDGVDSAVARHGMRPYHVVQL